jgi:uncharacterized protein
MSCMARRRIGMLVVAFLCAIAASVATGSAQNAPGPPAQGQGQPGAEGAAPRGPSMPRFAGKPRIRAMVIAGGCCHDYPAESATLMRLLQNELPIDWSFEYLGWGANRDLPSLYADPDWYKGYDIVVHNDCFTPPDSLVSDRYLSNVAAATRAGIPAVVIHCAMHTFRDEPSDVWRTVLGVRTVRHDVATNLPVRVVAPQHPVMAGIQTDWVTPVDELYVIEKTFSSMTPLAVSHNPAGGPEYPVAWVHQNGARVFGTTLGHGADTWADPVYQKMIVQGFRWALGQ